MASNLPPGHYHPGASTRSLLDAPKVLKAIGLKKGHSFLDAGSGSGYMSVAASDIVGSEGRVYAIDINKESIDALKEKINARSIRNTEALAADLTGKTPLADESINVCLMANVMHGFVENKEVSAVMKETTRVLKAGAILAVVDFKKLENIPGPPFPLKLSPEQMAALITPYHYLQKKVVEAGQYHYAVIFTRE